MGKETISTDTEISSTVISIDGKRKGNVCDSLIGFCEIRYYFKVCLSEADSTLG